MAEELQGLLDRIQSEGVAKAEAEAKQILDAAREKAASIVAEAEKKAEESRESARREAGQFEERARKALHQAARDLMLSVGEALNDTARRVIAAKVREGLTGDTLAALMADAVKAYFQPDGHDKAVLLASPEADASAREKLEALLARELLDGLAIESNSEIISGFMIEEADGGVRHNFTGEALTDTLCRLLRPSLADIVREAMKGEASG